MNTQKKNQKSKLKLIRTNLRLNTPSPKVIKHAKDYTRKDKHKLILKREYYET